MKIRTATPEDANAIAQVHVAAWRSTYRGLLPDDLLANLSEADRAQYWREEAQAIGADPTRGTILVAEAEDGALAGFASAGPEREPDAGFDAELYAIYLLEDHQGRGLGRRLVERVVEWMRGLGHRSMRVWVLEGNPAEAFYRRLGGKRVETKVIRIGNEDYNEVAYGWESLELTPLAE